MPRLPRVVIPKCPHHIAQRGNRRQRVFFSPEDYKTYLKIIHASCVLFDVEIWSYCLIPNHTHLIVVPSTEKSLALAIGKGHEAYTRYINFKKKWRGYLWQGRFSSFPMDEEYLLQAARYIELNPVSARLAANPSNYLWSSARAHLGLEKSPYINTQALLNRIPHWKSFLAEGLAREAITLLEMHQRTGRPLGSTSFLKGLETLTGLSLLPKKRGRPLRTIR